MTFYVPSGKKTAFINSTEATGFAGPNNPWASLPNLEDLVVEE